MKNYKVKSIMRFTDKEENIKRLPYDKNLTEEENMKRGSIFYCAEERYNFLKNKNAVKLIEIVEEKEAVLDATIDETINEVVDEVVEEIVKKKRKKSKK